MGNLCCDPGNTEHVRVPNRDFNEQPRQELYRSTEVTTKQPRAGSSVSYKNEENKINTPTADTRFKRKKIDILKPQSSIKPSIEERILSDQEKIFIEDLKQIQNQAVPFIEEIKNFTELEDSNQYYYIEESLRRLIEKLDDMHDSVENNKYLRNKRKEVYKFIFPLFDKLDEKIQENKAMMK